MQNAQLARVEERWGAADCDQHPVSICDALKQRTQAQHLRLEQRLALFERVRSLQDYRELLGKFYGIYAPLEPVLRRSLTPLLSELDWVEREKTPRLSADLTACGLSDAAIVALPRCQPLAPFPSQSQALGQLYVIEGATLGGQLIGRHLRLALKRNSGLAFFTSYGAAVPERWRQFRTVLINRVITPVQQEEAVEAAVELFKIFDRWLNAGAES